MSKKVMSVILALIVGALCISLVACSDNTGGETTTSSSTTVAGTVPVTQRAQDGKFIVGFDASFPPMGFTKDDGKYDGFDLDLAKAVAQKLGLEYVEKPIEWANKDTALSSGLVDCIWNGFTMSADRIDKYTWTDAYMNNDQVVVVLKSSSYNTLESLADKKCGVQKGSSAIDAIDANPQFKATIKDIIEKPDNTIILTDLNSGVIDFAVMDSVVANYMNTTSNGKYRILEKVLVSEKFGIGFNLGNTVLRDKVQTALKDLYADGTSKTISNKWFGKDVFINMSATAATTVPGTTVAGTTVAGTTAAATTTAK